jgi:NhaP-type Na+/H+ or K+/H+ antiporter
MIGSFELQLVVVVYFISFASRFISITCFFKWLKNIGYGMSMKEVFIIAFTGLKGAIGISLAMLAYEN